MRLRAVRREDVLVLDTQLETLGRWASFDVARIVNEGVVDDFAVDVDDAEAADAVPTPSGVFGEDDAFAVDCDWGARRDKVETGRELFGAADVGFAAAAMGLLVGHDLVVGLFGRGLGLGGDRWTAVGPGDLVCGNCRDRHVGRGSKRVVRSI